MAGLLAKRPRGMLIDLDGTLYHGSRMIDGADVLIRMLQQRGIRYLFVTNNSSAAPEVVADRLSAMGIPAKPEEVCTSAQAAAQYIAQMQPQAGVFVVGEDGLRAALCEAGLRVRDTEPDYVVQGIDRSLTYERITEAVRPPSQRRRLCAYKSGCPDSVRWRLAAGSGVDCGYAAHSQRCRTGCHREAVGHSDELCLEPDRTGCGRNLGDRG